MILFLKRFFVFKNDGINTIAYLALSLLLLTIAYDYAYMKFEKMDSVLTMVYYNVVTASTVGYGDFSPQTFWGKIITVIYIPLAIALFAAILSVAGTMIHGNITRKQRGIKFIGHEVDFLIIGGYKAKIITLAKSLVAEGKRVAILNDHHEVIPYEYKKEGIAWVKGGYHELNMFIHDKVLQYIVLSDDPTKKESDIRNNFIVEKIIEHSRGQGRILVEAVEQEKYTGTKNTRYMDITKASLIAREAIIPDSMIAMEDILDNGEGANQINIIMHESLTIAEIATKTSKKISKGICCPIGYFNGDKWEYISTVGIESNHTRLKEGTKVKFIINGEIEQEFVQDKPKDMILILAHDTKRVQRLIKNYLLDTRFKNIHFFSNLDMEGVSLYSTDEKHGETNLDKDVKLKFSKIVILANLFDETSDERNFYLWGKMREKVSPEVKLIVEMTDERNRDTLEKKYEDVHNEFVTYSNTGAIVQELQDSGFVSFLEDKEKECVSDVNIIMKTNKEG